MYMNHRLPYIQFLIGALALITFILATFNICPFSLAVFSIALLNFTFALSAYHERQYPNFVLSLGMGIAFIIAGLIIMGT
ncbi:DUF3894 domain-containing protein [Bacillus sp. JJ864]|uniref:DUF3894 domain-containing protein n=1 Tax=Bacillus sp. JJ864 TaxID=3122975 RepID=UPI0030004801